MPMDPSDESRPADCTAPLRTIRSRRNVPPADKVTEGQIAALAAAARKRGIRIALRNGMVIGPDGLEDLWAPWEVETGKLSPGRSTAIN